MRLTMRGREVFRLHPFLFSILPILHVYGHNYMDYPPWVLLRPLCVLLAVTAALSLVLTSMMKDPNRSAVMVTLLMVLFFSYGPVRDVIQSSVAPAARLRYIIALYFVGAIVLAGGTIRWKTDFGRFTGPLNFSGLVLVGVALINLVVVMQGPSVFVFPPRPAPGNPQLPAFGSRPDIYYIILDGYGGEREHRDILGFDNAGFTDYLRRKGFFVAARSRSNYGWTRLSVASTLNMEYLPSVSGAGTEGPILSRRPFSETVVTNRVRHFLESQGYLYRDLSIWTGWYRGLGFETGLVRMSLLSLPFMENYVGGLLTRSSVLETLRILENLEEADRPTFTYAHVMLPHHPFMFDEKGGKPPFFSANTASLHMGQVKYVNERIKAVVEHILASSRREPVIIIQGDHGPNGMFPKPTPLDVPLRMGILNAYYLPEGKKTRLYDTITPVNTFRIVLDSYFNAGYGLLPDRSFYTRTENDMKLMPVPTENSYP